MDIRGQISAEYLLLIVVILIIISSVTIPLI
ncbi:MAG: class III signal peptide-containing protein, partial [Methanobacterium sp.]